MEDAACSGESEPVDAFLRPGGATHSNVASRMRRIANFKALCLISLVGISPSIGGHPVDGAEGQWPMASGPLGTWATPTDQKIPLSWSVSTGANVRWKTVLPEAGQSGIALWGNRIFLTINAPLPEGTLAADARGTDIVGYCLDADNGAVKWTVTLPSPKSTPYSGLFSDNSSPTPVTDGTHVWFVNAGGLIACFDLDGREVWRRPFESRTRHAAKQAEPMLVGNQLLYVMMRDPDDPLRRPMKAAPGERETPPEFWPWTFIRSFDARTGAALWTESSGTSVHNTPQFGYVDDSPVILHLRGGGHLPPESPYGFSLSSLEGDHAGQPLWQYESEELFAYTVSTFDERHAYGFEQGDLIKLDVRSGELINRFPLFEKADIRLWNATADRYETHRDAPFSVVTEKFQKAPTNATPILVGNYFLFMTHEGHCIGRVDTETGRTEFFQVPVQVVRVPGQEDEQRWDRHIPADGRNSRGIVTAADRRAQGDGWGHVTVGSPIAINQYVLFSTMIGMTYVVDSQSAVFDESALVSINDLGPAGETWSLSTPSYAQGRIVHRSLKEVVCLEISR